MRASASLVSITVIAAALCATSAARAGSTSYADVINLAGISFTDIVENSSSDATPLFGMPTALPNRLVFNNPTFVSSSAGGLADTTAGTIAMRLQAADGKFIEKVIFTETGEFEFEGNGTNATATTASGALTVIVLTPGVQGVHNVSLKLTPVPIYMLSMGDGTFSGIAEVDLTGLNVTDALVSFSNYLQSSSELGTTATIRKNRIIIDTPEPATVLLALAGMIPLTVRRRRCR
jgi:hypothetical protein